MTPTRKESAVFRVWPSGVRWSQRFVIKRLLAMTLLGVIPATLCASLGHGLWSLVILTIGVWPLPYRLTVARATVQISWLFVTERIGRDAIVDVRLEPDARRWIVSRRRMRLCIERRDAPSIFLDAKESSLSALYGLLTAPG